MRTNGVTQFSLDGLAVVFHPKTVSHPGAEATQPATKDPALEPPTGTDLKTLLASSA